MDGQNKVGKDITKDNYEAIIHAWLTLNTGIKSHDDCEYLVESGSRVCVDVVSENKILVCKSRFEKCGGDRYIIYTPLKPKMIIITLNEESKKIITSSPTRVVSDKQYYNVPYDKIEQFLMIDTLYKK